MPEIKIKHVVSFSSEDKVHRAENLVKPETYRKWKCATPGEKSATVVLQFEKAMQINAIDIGNDSSAFVEVLVGRSSDSANNFQVLLVASSFMSPLESRNGTHTNRVRMFGPEKLSQSTKDEKWDYVQVVCTQPFNKTISYGLSFIKFHSPPDKTEQPKNIEAETSTKKIGAFKLKYEDEEDSLSVGSWFGKQKTQIPDSPSTGSLTNKTAPSYATAVLASTSNSPQMPRSPQNNSQKRKIDEHCNSSHESSPTPPVKKVAVTTDINKDNIIYKDVLRDELQSKKNVKNVPSSKNLESKKTAVVAPVTKPSNMIAPVNKPSNVIAPVNKPSNSASVNKPSNSTVKKPMKLRQKVPFEKIMDGVVFVLSGFVNPIRSQLRDKALEMGAKYKGDWDSSCTHLVCAFINTPKYTQVKNLKGRIVSKEWILDCYNKKDQLPWSRYMLGKLARDVSSDESESEENYSEEESDVSEEYIDSEEEYNDKKKKKRKPPKFVRKKKNSMNPSNIINQPHPSSDKTKKDLNTSNTQSNSNTANGNGISSNSSQKNKVSNSSPSRPLLTVNDESETEDEEALQDYVAKTDVDSSSGGDTEDEIRKVEMKTKKNGKSPAKKKISECLEKPDVSNLSLPELPNLFKRRKFFLFGEFSPSKRHDMQRFIIAYNGIIEDYMNDQIKYVITDAKWDKHFEDALGENEDLIFAKPTWIYKCHEAGKLVPYQPYIVIPDS